MFEEIVLPVDFTPANRPALEVASELAAEASGRVHLLHVIERIENLPPGSLEGFYRKLEQRAQREMRPMARRLDRNGVLGRSDIRYGRRVEEIVRYAFEQGADLIVLSSHAVDVRSGPRAIGSLSHQVAVFAHGAVLLVR